MGLGAPAFAAPPPAVGSPPPATSLLPDQLSAAERAFVASKIYASLELYFAHWQAVQNLDVDAAYKTYLAAAFQSEDRLAFDMATREFVARFKNGHTFFVDRWLSERFGQPLGFYAAHVDGKWMVQRSALDGVKPGDAIRTIDSRPFEQFFRDKQKVLFASNERQARAQFCHSPFLFPLQFQLTLDNGRKIAVDRRSTKELPPTATATEGRWLKPEAIAYVRIPSFHEPKFQEQAIALIREYQKAPNLIIDLRDNGGGNTPGSLIRALMDRPWRSYVEASPLTIGLLRNYAELARRSDVDESMRQALEMTAELFRHPSLSWPSAPTSPEPGAFAGKLLLLVDGGCGSACEDFVAPFKDNHRAVVAGETTFGSSGQPFFYDFQNGMRLGVSTKRESLPDGAPFEGVGIVPDLLLLRHGEELRSGKDGALLRAIEYVGRAEPGAKK